ncbi:MAG: hypothetical protein ACRCZP_14530 [Phycicoccus sp.]
MTIDVPAVNAIFSGLVLLLGAVAALVTARGRRASVRRRDYRDLERRFLAALAHIFALETDLAGLGRNPRPRPAALDADDEPDATPAVLPPQPRPEEGNR